MESGAKAPALALASNTTRTSAQPHALDLHPAAIERGAEGLHVAWLPDLDPIRNDRLALILVRLDTGRETRATGDYTISLDATPRAGE